MGGSGDDRGSGPVYESRYVELLTQRLGRLSVWLCMVSADHRYNDSSTRDRLGAGLMRNPQTVISEAALGPAALRPAGGFGWKVLAPFWESYLLYIDADTDADPAEEGQRLAEAARRGLTLARLLPR